MRDAPTGVRTHLGAALNVLGLFNLFKKEPAKETTPPPAPIIEVKMPGPAYAPPAAPTEEEIKGLRRDLRFRGLHADTNPSSSVRPGEMTCTACSRTFRYFSNANGVAATARCPGCTRVYRV